MKTKLQYAKTLIFFIFIFHNTVVTAQKRGIEFNNLKKNTVDFIIENKRVKIKTTDGKTLIGRFKVIDSVTIQLNDKPINIEKIVMIKSTPVGVTVISNILIGLGATIIFGGIIVDSQTTRSPNAIVDPIPVSVITLPVGLVLGSLGGVIPTFNNSHPIKKWNYRIIE